jgi:hypothetical protein
MSEQTKQQTCANCRYFSDHRDTEPDDEMNGYCTYDFIHKVPNEYGGHWTHHAATCGQWEAGPSLWVPCESGGNVLSAGETPAPQEPRWTCEQPADIMGQHRCEATDAIAALATCYRLTGADPDGNEDWRLAKHAVEEVRRLRNESDAEIDRLEAENTRLRAALEELPYVLAQLRHAYEQVHGYRVSRRGMRAFADGLLAPQIRKLEQMQALE